MKPLMPYNISPGGDYWASWGSKGWSAVQATHVKRKWVKVNRMDPKTNEVKKRGARVRADELVKRDPSKCGADKPTEGPDVVFADVRQHREASQSKQLVLNKRSDKGSKPTDTMTEEELIAYRTQRALTADARWAKVEEAFGQDVVSQWATDEDW